MDIENGTWVQLKSDTSKAYLVSSSSASNEFLDWFLRKTKENYCQLKI